MSLISLAKPSDISSMVVLSDQKRSAYEQAQPKFWKRADNANKEQTKWFSDLLLREDHICLISKSGQEITGFIIGKLMLAPEVYSPGGFTLIIDDFCVSSPDFWLTVGEKLLYEIQQQAKKRGAVQTVIVCGYHDAYKQAFLKSQNLIIASEWYVKSI